MASSGFAEENETYCPFLAIARNPLLLLYQWLLHNGFLSLRTL